tara:strand:+ start:558 stop:734 length:177 start_codon:yes stop_codon:yes gene_type:complete
MKLIAAPEAGLRLVVVRKVWDPAQLFEPESRGMAVPLVPVFAVAAVPSPVMREDGICT